MTKQPLNYSFANNLWLALLSFIRFFSLSIPSRRICEWGSALLIADAHSGKPPGPKKTPCAQFSSFTLSQTDNYPILLFYPYPNYNTALLAPSQFFICTIDTAQFALYTAHLRSTRWCASRRWRARDWPVENRSIYCEVRYRVGTVSVHPFTAHHYQIRIGRDIKRFASTKNNCSLRNIVHSKLNELCVTWISRATSPLTRHAS